MPDELDQTGAAPFTPARRGGYEREEVDAFVASLQRRIAELEARPTPSSAVSRALEQVGGTVTAILQQAHDSAEELTITAEGEAAAALEGAAREAAAISARAQERVRELDLDTDRIWAERERLLEDVIELAQRLLALVETANDRFPAQPAERSAGVVEPAYAAGDAGAIGAVEPAGALVEVAFGADDAGALGDGP